MIFTSSILSSFFLLFLPFTGATLQDACVSVDGGTAADGAGAGAAAAGDDDDGDDEEGEDEEGERWWSRERVATVTSRGSSPSSSSLSQLLQRHHSEWKMDVRQKHTILVILMVFMGLETSILRRVSRLNS